MARGKSLIEEAREAAARIGRKALASKATRGVLAPAARLQKAVEKAPGRAFRAAEKAVTTPVKFLSEPGRDVQRLGEMVEKAGRRTTGFSDFQAIGDTFTKPVRTSLKDPTGAKRVGSLATFMIGDSLQDLGATESAFARGGIAAPFQSAGNVFKRYQLATWMHYQLRRVGRLLV